MNPTFAACSTFGSGEEAVRMARVLASADDLRLDTAKELSISFAELLPVPGGDGLDVARFLQEAAHALRVREAELARLQGISQATLSSWKKRGAIPQQGLTWFQEQFVPAVLKNTRPQVSQSIFEKGYNVALAIFDQTDFNPFGETFETRADRIEFCYANLTVLGNLGTFVVNRLLTPFGGDLDYRKDLWDRIVPKTLELARLGWRLI